MVTIGVDLAAQDRDTGLCRVRWHEPPPQPEVGRGREGGHGRAAARGREAARDGGRVATVELAQRGVGDEQILAEADAAVAGGGAVGVDAPFGWPIAFVDAVTGWADGGGWPLDRPVERAARAQQSGLLRLRVTDRFVAATTKAAGRARYPLSVSTDKIGICAMRAAALLTAAAVADPHTADSLISPSRVDGPWFEVYPAAARELWKLPTANDKRDRGAREARLDCLVAHMAGADATLVFRGETRAACIDSDDVLDALLCAFLARAAALRRSWRPRDETEAAAAKREGWIHLPSGGLADLFVHGQE